MRRPWSTSSTNRSSLSRNALRSSSSTLKCNNKIIKPSHLLSSNLSPFPLKIPNSLSDKLLKHPLSLLELLWLKSHLQHLNFSSKLVWARQPEKRERKRLKFMVLLKRWKALVDSRRKLLDRVLKKCRTCPKVRFISLTSFRVSVWYWWVRSRCPKERAEEVSLKDFKIKKYTAS